VARACIRRHYLIPYKTHRPSDCARERLYLVNGSHLKETTMRKTVLTILAASLIVGSTIQIAGAAERHAQNLDRRARAHRAVPLRQ